VKKLVLLFFVNLLIISCYTQNIASSITCSHGIFTTSVTTTVNASQIAVNNVVNKFITHYKTDLPALFPWALKGVNLQGETDKLMIFNIKSHTLGNDGVVRGMMDMTVVPLGKTYTDVTYSVLLTKVKDTPNDIVISYKLYDCQEIIKTANATLTITRTTNNAVTISLVADVTLTRFYNLLITRKMYEDAIGWRFVNFIRNIANTVQNY